MDNFDLKKYLAEGKLLKEKATHEAKNNIKEDYTTPELRKASDALADAVVAYRGASVARGVYKGNDKWTAFEKAFSILDNDLQSKDTTMDEVSEAGDVTEDYKNDYANSEEDYTDRMVMEKIFDIIKYHELDPSEVLEVIGQEYGIDFEFGSGDSRGSQHTPS